MVIRRRTQTPFRRQSRRRLQRRPRQRPSLVTRILKRDLQTWELTQQITTPGTAITYQSVFNPTQGTGSGSRYGDRCYINSIQLRWYANAQSSTNVNYLRVCLVWDKQPNGALPTSPQPFDAATLVSFKDPDFSNRFMILRDWRIQLGYSPTLGLSPFQDYYKKCGSSFMTTFNGNAGTIADITSGALILVTFGNDNTNKPTMEYNVRIMFNS